MRELGDMSVEEKGCPFCGVGEESRTFLRDDFVLGLWDKYPVSPGHALLIPRRHISSWFEATPSEQNALLQALSISRQKILRRFQADGFNIGINDGQDAGQTIPHLHIHLIPRYKGDVADPTGGVRYVIPSKANYLKDRAVAEDISSSAECEPTLIRGEDDPILPYLEAHLETAVQVDIAVAFTMRSGLQRIGNRLHDLLARGGILRFLTGDYLSVTEPEALLHLLDLQDNPDLKGKIELRIFRAGSRSFHPKAYIFHHADGTGTAIVGSSNLSAMALEKGVEWNYRVISSRDRMGFEDVVDAFDKLFLHSSTLPLDFAWIEGYKSRRQIRITDPVEVEPDVIEPPPQPHEVQREALQKLEESRAAGNSAGLIVLATGLGKTWLSAFDSNRPEFQRVLFVAHREEILSQAQQTYRRIRPEARLGFFTGQERDREADILFASVQTLSRLQHLRSFAPEYFDYIVIDEFHHAAARTYRRLIDHFDPQFLLGLTATPERTDGGDLLSLCQENLVYRCDIPRGIRSNLLCPFHYYGVPDEVDYRNIPWRSNRFDIEELTHHLATRARARNALDQYREKGGRSTLAFCCSTKHADFMKEFFIGEGVHAAAVHSEPSSDPRAASLEKLNKGELEVVFSVDMFNEGVDLPDVDTIMMLRPTESRILWLQQFGRGLRWGEEKTLKVIDYIGNHRSFLNKPQTLFQILFDVGPGYAPVAQKLQQLREGVAELPPGCAVTYDLETIQILEPLFQPYHASDAIEVYYLDFQERYGRRPSAVEVFHEGFNLRSLRRSYGSWFQFVGTMEELSSTQKDLLVGQTGDFLTALETTQMTKSYKMLTLLAMLNEDNFPGEIHIDELVKGFTRLARRSEFLRTDISEDLEDSKAIKLLLEDNPIKAWVGGKGTGSQSYFFYESEIFQSEITVDEKARDDFQEFVRELIDWRLADYLSRKRESNWNEDQIVCRVIHSSGKPILKLPHGCEDRRGPWDWQDIVAEGVRYKARFVKYFINLIRGERDDENYLPRILRSWFGEDVGRPGTRFQVVLERRGEVYELLPLGQPAIEETAQLFSSYSREEIPLLFGLDFVKGLWQQQGFINQEDHMFCAHEF